MFIPFSEPCFKDEPLRDGGEEEEGRQEDGAREDTAFYLLVLLAAALTMQELMIDNKSCEWCNVL